MRRGWEEKEKKIKMKTSLDEAAKFKIIKKL